MSRRDSWSPEVAESDPIVTVFPSRSRSVVNRTGDDAGATNEHDPLLGNSVRRKKPFYRARPLWLVPFAVVAALVRGMTLAPRVTVFNQLSCSRLHPSETFENSTDSFLGAPSYLGDSESSSSFLVSLGDAGENGETGEGDSRQLPSRICASDPAVPAGTAKIQATYSTTMGVLCALTTGWWGNFGDRYGRTRVLAIASFGWFITDVIFILASSPISPLASHGHKLILIAPVFEGLLGGWSTLQSATSAYISDCTSSGSRASIFSRFTGVGFLGFSLGPVIGAWLIRHPIAFLAGPPHPGQTSGQSVTSVFWVAAIGSFINFCLVLFVFPESVSKEQRARARRPAQVLITGDVLEPTLKDAITFRSLVQNFFSPLRVFLPAPIYVDGRKHKDWSLTLLVTALFGYLLSAGLYQIKYLYGSYVYSWTPEQLSYYISFMGGGRALFLLFALPVVISTFKPKSNISKPPPGPGGKVTKPKPTKEHLAREIKFDLRLARVSLCIDIFANAAIVTAPAPSYKMHAHINDGTATDAQFRVSQALFVMSSWTASWGAGLVPAIHSLALSIMQSRALLAEGASNTGDGVEPAELPAIDVSAQAGKVFGSLAILQATGQMILGPLLFGLIYSGTVATFPKAVFVTAIVILFFALLMTLLVRSPLAHVSGKGKAPIGGQRRHTAATAEDEGEERGRSRTSKDLRGYGSTGNSSAEAPAGPSSSSYGSN